MKGKVVARSVFNYLRLAFASGDRLGENAKPAPVDVIISLTTIPSRLSAVHITIKSLLNQDICFDKIVLWLHRDLESAVPSALQRLQGDRFEICYSQTTEPHRKLVETLKQSPESFVVTCDDDMMYPTNWLSRLIESWQDHPDDIVAHMCCQIRVKNGEIQPYRTWPPVETWDYSSPSTMTLGFGGVLYPPQSLDSQVLNRDTYMRLCPNADDLWFKTMATLKGTAMRKSRNSVVPLPILGTQSISLAKENIGEDRNRTQILALIDHFNLHFDDLPD